MKEFYLIYLFLMSLTTSIFYTVDKQKSIKHKWRISEKILLILTFIGGGLGAYITMTTIRHKTKHWYFYATAILGMVWQFGLLYYLYFVM